MQDSVIDEAYTEKAVREERAEPVRYRYIDLAEPGALHGMPVAASEKVPAGSDFGSEVWDLGDNYMTGEDNSDRRGSKYRPTGEVGELVASGHGFNIRRYSNPDLPEYCMFCGTRLIPPALEWPCEFEPGVGMPIVKDGNPPRYCRCNGCQVRQMGVRKRGGQPRKCKSKECAQTYNRNKSKIARDREANRNRQAALALLRGEPYRSDKSIADQLGIPRKRVKEARELSVSTKL